MYTSSHLFPLLCFSLSLCLSLSASFPVSPSMFLFLTHKQAPRKSAINYVLGTLYNKVWALSCPVELRRTAPNSKEAGISSDNTGVSYRLIHHQCIHYNGWAASAGAPWTLVFQQQWIRLPRRLLQSGFTLYLPLLWAAALARKQLGALRPHQRLLFSAAPFPSAVAFATINQSKQTPCSFSLGQLPSTVHALPKGGLLSR